MTGPEFRAARLSLGLTQKHAAIVFDCTQTNLSHAERRPIVKGSTARLMQAFCDGYRPADWPIPAQGSPPILPNASVRNCD